MKTQAEIESRINGLTEERKALEFTYLTAQAEMRDRGQYGQCSQREIDECENAGMMLQLWDEEYSEELAELKKQYKGKDYVIFDQKL